MNHRGRSGSSRDRLQQPPHSGAVYVRLAHDGYLPSRVSFRFVATWQQNRYRTAVASVLMSDDIMVGRSVSVVRARGNRDIQEGG